MPTRLPDLIAGLLFLGLTLLLTWQTLGAVPEGTEAARNPVWYPRVLLALSGLASAGLVLRGLIGAGIAMPRPDYGRLAMMLVILAAYFWLFISIGFLLASVLAMPVLAFLMGYRWLTVSVPVALFFCIGVWFLFADVFVVRPPGPGVDAILATLKGE